MASRISTATPLAGLRVLDMGMFWAGPFAGKWLADAGAEVIKIESCNHPDNLRVFARGNYPGGEGGDRSWNRSGLVNDRNRNKIGVTIDLGTPRGRELLGRLVVVSDVVIENFSAGVLRRWNLDYSSLQKINPAIVLASLYSQGGDGPESGYVSYGSTLEQLGGLTFLTGYEDAAPGLLTVQIADALGGAMAAGLILAALRLRRRAGRGTHVDLSQRENLTSALGEKVLGYSMTGRVPERMGNSDPAMAPHDCYPCRGTDEWVTIAIETEDQWRRLCQVLARLDLLQDPRLLTAEGRRERSGELDQIITGWTERMDKGEAMRTLQAHGVPAGAVNNAADLFQDPHLRARQFWVAVDDPDAGMHRYAASPVRVNGHRLGGKKAAPTLGQDNEYVFGRLLGLAPHEIAEMEDAEIIGTQPTKAALRGQL